MLGSLHSFMLFWLADSGGFVLFLLPCLWVLISVFRSFAYCLPTTVLVLLVLKAGSLVVCCTPGISSSGFAELSPCCAVVMFSPLCMPAAVFMHLPANRSGSGYWVVLRFHLDCLSETNVKYCNRVTVLFSFVVGSFGVGTYDFDIDVDEHIFGRYFVSRGSMARLQFSKRSIHRLVVIGYGVLRFE